MSNELIENKHFDYRTYADYIKLNEVSTKQFLMISELIDNSISSFDNKYNGKPWKEKLEINIFIKMNTNVDDQISIDGIQVSKSSEILVVDNGFGMDKERLYTALKLNSVNKNTVSKMNVHGRGLKQCGFFFGVDLLVQTNNGAEASEMELALSKQKDGLNSRIVFEAKPSSFSKRGTNIKINHIHKNKIMTNANSDVVIDALEHRYGELIRSGNMDIFYEYQINGNKPISKYLSGAHEKIASVSDDFGAFSSKDIEKIIESVKKALENKIKLNKGDIYDKNIAWDAFNKMSFILREKDVDTSTLFMWEQQIPFKDTSFKCDFWLLPRVQAKYRGFRVFEGHRAILHPPITRTELTTYLDPLPATNRTGSTDNRFAGKFFISDIGAKTKTDKSTFDMPATDKAILDHSLRTVWEVFDLFIITARRPDIEPGRKPTKGDSVTAGLSSLKKYNDTIEVIEPKSDDEPFGFSAKVANETWYIYISIDKKPMVNDIFERKIIDADNKYEVTVYTSHAFWRKMDELPDFFAEVVYPITLLLVLQELNVRLKNDSILTLDEINNVGGTFKI